jgi:hypothetical protein
MRNTMLVIGILALSMGSSANTGKLELTALVAGRDKNFVSFQDDNGCKYAAKQWLEKGKAIELTLRSCEGSKMNLVSYRSAVIEADFEKGAKITFFKIQ